MSDESTPKERRSYGCQMGCGNAYDLILLIPADGTSLYLCQPDFFKLSRDMMEAFITEADPMILAEMAAVEGQELAPFDASNLKRRGHNAPVTSDDPDLMDAYDAYVTAEELEESEA